MAVDAQAVSFTDATAVKAIDSHTYSVELQDDWAIGTVPHGGYVTSCFLEVANKHFSTTLSKQNQPHTFTVHQEFPRRTEVGPAIFKVRDIKLGRQTSTIHISLVQYGREEVVAYLNHTNLINEKGVSFTTGWTLSPSAYPVDLSKLKAGDDLNWVEQRAMPFSSFRKASNRVRFFFPREGQKLKSLADQWITWRNGEKFTNTSLGYVCDMFPQIVESYVVDEDPYTVKHQKSQNRRTDKKNVAKFWYPTVVLNLDIKKLLPEKGVEWLFVRTQAKQIRKGRIDLEVIIMDEVGDIVALSHHVCLVLDAGRNTAKRRRNISSETKL
ncbi:uncharacterized protein PV09_05608 [Verruconis gallopava]|uniref:Thioesterase domain-containing protein n=1 Tax=Verruconis gallopava TaxID=253628 RepID=A0A0D2A9H8_9PEZI|nr:uncharacterized protein PV09_05608 [Verruconis gallopava]KIW03403.1 hypothetical protein PV09_05608 [Verruconis gallopava]